MRMVMILILSCMILGLLSTLMVTGSDEQVPAGDPLEEGLRSGSRGAMSAIDGCAARSLEAPVLIQPVLLARRSSAASNY